MDVIPELLTKDLRAFMEEEGHVFQDENTLCPFHDDKVPSLHVSQKEGSWLWYCHGCHQGGSIINFVMKKQGFEKRDAILWLADRYHLDNGNGKPELVASYAYQDEKGAELFKVLRFKPKAFRADKKMAGIRQVVYRLPEVLAAETVWLVEGEKDADNVRSLGLPATTSPFGVSHWRPEFSEFFKDKAVRILLDQGYREEAEGRAKDISRVAREVRIIELPGLEKDQDVSDFIEQRDAQSPGDIRAELERIAAEAPVYGVAASPLMTGAELQALDISVEWTIDKLQPARSLTLLHSRGGLGKTWLELGAAKAVNAGAPFLGLETKKRPVYYIDFENPLPLLVERLRKLAIRDVSFWHLSASTPPPKLDSPDWTLYKKYLKPGSLVIFDTLRAAHDGDENSSQDAAIVMGRLKQLRETGLDIVALHHTGKASDRVYKGSTAFVDLADHVLDFHRVRRDNLQEVDDEDLPDQDALFSLGTGTKTRFAPFRIFLSFNPETGVFSPAEDPKAGLLDQLAEYITGEGLGKNQTELVTWAKDALGIKRRDSILALLRRGDGSRWRTVKGFRNGRIYEPI